MKLILWLSLALAAGIYICNPVQDPDLWWHIASGRWIIAERAVPTLESWNMFALGQPWRAYSWSVEILFAAADMLGAERGLLALKLALAVLLALSLFYCLGKIAGDWFMGGLLGMYATAAVFNHFTLRPQSVVWVCLIWLIFTADRIARSGRWGANGFWLFALMAVWANTHLSALLGLLCVLAWLWPSAGRQAKETKRILGKGFLLCLAGTLATPYLGGEWLTLFSKTAHPLRFEAIAEFQAAHILQYSTGFLVLLGALLLGFLHKLPNALSTPKLLLGVVFSLMALAVVKFMPFAVIFLCALTAACWRAAGPPERAVLGRLGEAFRRLKLFFQKIPAEGLSFVFLASALVNVYKLWNYPLELTVVPASAVDFMQKQNLPWPVLNSFGNGGYLIYRYGDAGGRIKHPVVIDGRTNVTPRQVWDKYLAAFKGKRNWREYFELVNPQTVLWRADSPLVSILLSGSEWCLVFPPKVPERGSVVFLKREYWQMLDTRLPALNCPARPAAVPE